MKLPLLAVVLAAPLAAQTMSIEEYEPKSTLVVPQHMVTRARYPFIDVHNHQYDLTPAKVDKLVADMDGINLRIMVNLSGGYGDKLAQNVHILKDRYQDRFVVFANLDFSNIDAPDYGRRAAARLEQDVSNGAQGLKFFKNFGMDLRDGKGQRIHVDDPRFDLVWDMCAKLHIPVLIHTAEPWSFFQPQDRFNERWLELKQFPQRARPPDRYPSWETLIGEQHHLFALHPNTIFINAHLGWLGGNLAELGRLMDQMPNMYTEIGAVLAELGRQPRFAREWFIQHQDRVLFGKMCGRPKNITAISACWKRPMSTSTTTASATRSGRCTGSTFRTRFSKSFTIRMRCGSSRAWTAVLFRSRFR